MQALIWMVLGYLAGSCPTGYLLVKLLRGEDIRNFGSGNIGATNVRRVMGQKWAVVVSLSDMLKGGLMVLLASFFTQDDSILALVGVCSVLGHNFPVWLKFKGGKGVSTTFGVLAFYNFFNPLPALIAGAIWYFFMKLTNYVSAASIIALPCGAVLTYLFGMPTPYTAAAAFLAALSIWRHRSNIVRLMNGTESKVRPEKKK